MRTIITGTFLLALLTVSASAMPLASIKTGSQPAVIQVAGGCGPGWHRGPYGGCLRNFANPAMHACPRGFHIGPGGRCRGNGR
jgi:hypothetical protein